MKIISPQDFITKGYYHIPLIISNSLFLSLFAVLAWHQRLATDDFYFLNILNQHGVLNGVLTEYQTWSTRFSSVGLNLTILHYTQKTPWVLTVFSLFGLFAFVMAVFWNIKNTITFVFKGMGDKEQKSIASILNVSMFIVSVFFISSVKIDETWFWLCSSCTYLWSVIMCLFSTGWLLSKTNRFPYFVLGLTGFAFVGGASGPLAIILLLGLAVSTAFTSKIADQLNLSRNALRTKTILGFLTCLITFTVLYLGQGNRAREMFFDEVSLLSSFILNIKMTGIVFLKRLPLTVLIQICLIFPLVYFGSMQRKNKHSSWKKIPLFLSLIYLSIIFIYQWSITYKTQDIAAYRALFFVSVSTAIYLAFLLYYLAKNLATNKLTSILCYASFLFGPLLFGYHLVNQSQLAPAYANSYDDRMFSLQNLKVTNGQLTVLQPLKTSGMLYSAEISVDSAFHANKHLEQALNLSGPLVVK